MRFIIEAFSKSSDFNLERILACHHRSELVHLLAPLLLHELVLLLPGGYLALQSRNDGSRPFSLGAVHHLLVLEFLQSILQVLNLLLVAVSVQHTILEVLDLVLQLIVLADKSFILDCQKQANNVHMLAQVLTVEWSGHLG
jgi:hypothetical protein